MTKEDKELLHTITTSAGYELLKLPTDGNDLEMSKNVDLKIKINAISIPLYKSIHLKIVDGTSSNISNKKVSDKNATQTDAISEMVNDLKLEHDLASTSQFVRTSKVGDKTYKMNIVLRYIIAFCRTVYLLHKRTDVQFIESFIDYSQYAPGSVVISFPVDVTFTGSGKIIELKLKKENSTDEVINESVSKSTESATPAITTSAATTTTTATTTATGDVTTEKILTANITEWTSKPEKALLYFTGCISGHTELEWKISYVRIMSNSD